MIYQDASELLEKIRVENEYMKFILEKANDNKSSDINKNRGR